MKVNERYVENKLSWTYRILCDILICCSDVLLTNCRNELGNSDSDKRTTGTDGANCPIF